MKKLLMIEDDQFIRDLYQRQLQKAGFEVKTTPSGVEGLELLKTEKYDLLILDINIPDFSGFQVLKYLKENPKVKDQLIILVLSNVTQTELIQKATELGAAAFIVKSTYTPDKVVDEIKSLLS